MLLFKEFNNYLAFIVIFFLYFTLSTNSSPVLIGNANDTTHLHKERRYIPNSPFANNLTLANVQGYDYKGAITQPGTPIEYDEYGDISDYGQVSGYGNGNGYDYNNDDGNGDSSQDSNTGSGYGNGYDNGSGDLNGSDDDDESSNDGVSDNGGDSGQDSGDGSNGESNDYGNGSDYQSSNGSSNGTVQGTATWYEQEDGPGSCGEYHDDSDYICALSNNLNPGYKGPMCDRHIRARLNDDSGGNSIQVVVKDTCASCEDNHIDLSIGAFNDLSNNQPEIGVLQITWEFID